VPRHGANTQPPTPTRIFAVSEIMCNPMFSSRVHLDLPPWLLRRFALLNLPCC